MGQLRGAPFRKLHRQSGESIRWWKAVPVPEGTAGREGDGRLLQEQTIASAVKFLVSNTEENYESHDWGLIQKGTLQISAFPDKARFNHLDRIALLAPGRRLSAYTPKSFARGSGTEDDFVFSPVMSISHVWIGGVLADSDNYEATETGINWLLSAPAQGTKYSVEYVYSPRYIVLPNRQKTSPTDKTGIALPLHYWLNLEQKFDSA